MNGKKLIWIAKQSANKDEWTLQSPAVGIFTINLKTDKNLIPGSQAGQLIILGQPIPIFLPSDIGGIISVPTSQLIQKPVSFGENLLKISSKIPSTQHKKREKEVEEGFFITSPQAGRFYYSSNPESPKFVSIGDKIEIGKTVGLLEVMKTFSPVKWLKNPNKSTKAIVKKILVKDAADVKEKQPLIELDLK